MPKRILLADDSITIQKVVELTFSDGDYEVVAVNNGAKAIQKLSEMRPDLILSDIIMPEKNGYEVCEYVKSHPEFRTIPVVLLTGTFEPFDPDRADKAGCDAVVTKPFESQSLIHKVEELIQQARANAQSAPPPPQPSTDSPFSGGFSTPGGFAPPPPPSASWETTAPAWNTAEPSPFGGAPAQPFESPAASFAATEPPVESPSFGSESSAFSAAAPAFGDEPPAFGAGAESFATSSDETLYTPAAPSPFSSGFASEAPSPFSSAGYAPSSQPDAFAAGQSHDNEIFGAAATNDAPSHAPMPFEDASPAAAADPFGGETRAFPRMNFDDLQQPPAAPEPVASPWDEQADSGATRAFPRMSFDELQQMASAPAEQPATPSAPAPEPSPWDEQADSGATRAFPRMSFDELQQMAAPAAEDAAPLHPAPQPAAEQPLWHAPEPPPAAPAAGSDPSPWHSPEPIADAGETRAFPSVSFDDLQRMQTQAGDSPLPESHVEEPAPIEASPWDQESQSDLGATRAFPRMSFDELQQMSAAAEEAPLSSPPAPVAAAAPEPSPWDEPETAAPQWNEPAAHVSHTDSFASSSPFTDEQHDEPMSSISATADTSDAAFEPAGAAPLLTEAAPIDDSIWPAATSMPDEAQEPAAAPAQLTVPPSHDDASNALGGAIAAAAGPVDLTQEQVDRIARRVVEMMSEQVVRSIAWEVIPDVAQMAVKERIRQLESEA
jgi:CheY-like chemotaxis protein